MQPLYFRAHHDGVRRSDGVLGVVTRESVLNYCVKWADGTSSTHEQGDSSIDGFPFMEGEDRWGRTGVTGDPLYRQIHDDWALWSKAGPRPDAPSLPIIPIEADTTGYGYPRA